MPHQIVKKHMHPAHFFTLVLCFLEIFIPTKTSAASFDCSKAVTKVEKMVCNNVVLSNLDDEMGRAYFYLNKYYTPDTLKADQRAWLKERNTCTNENCLQSKYNARIDILHSAYSVRWSRSSPLNIRIEVDCTKASTKAAYLICNNPDLLELDKKLAWAYSEAEKINSYAAISAVKGFRKFYEPSWREKFTESKFDSVSETEIYHKNQLIREYKTKIFVLMRIIDPFNELDPNQKQKAQKHIALLNDDDWLTGIWVESWVESKGGIFTGDILIDKVDGNYIVKSHDDRNSTNTNWVGKVVRHDDYVEFWYYRANGVELFLDNEPDRTLQVRVDREKKYLEESNECNEGRKWCIKYRFESNETSLIEKFSKLGFTTGENYIRRQIQSEKNFRQQSAEYFNKLNAEQKQKAQKYIALHNDDDWFTGIWGEPTDGMPEDILIEKVNENYTVKSHYNRTSVVTHWVGKVVRHDDYVEFWYYIIKNGELVLTDTPTRTLYLKKHGKYTEIEESYDCLEGERCISRYSSADRYSVIYHVNDKFITGESYLRSKIEKEKKLRKNGTEHYDLLMDSKSIKQLDGDVIYDLRVVKEIFRDKNKFVLLFIESGEIAHSGHCGSSTDAGYYWFNLSETEKGQWKIVDEWGKKNNSCMTNSGWNEYEKENKYYLSLNDYLNNYETLECFYFDLIHPEKGFQSCPIED